MSNHRATHYHCKSTRTVDGYSTTELYKFTEFHAAAIGAILHSDGIDLAAAIKLCELWTRNGPQTDIQYSYSVPFVKGNR